MRRVFLDEDVEPKLELCLDGFEVQSIAKLKMQSTKNGALLRWMAANGYEVLIAKDRKIPFQNPLKKIGVAVVIIRGMGELAPRFIESPGQLRHVVATVPIGEWVEVFAP